jgi:DNA-directed RNA polymerase specialized sigma24 family protein
MTRTWTSDTDTQKPGETTDEQKLRAWFERLPRMRALIRQQQEHIASLRSAATTITSSTSGAPGHSGTSDKVGTNSDAAIDAEAKLAELKCQYAEMQKSAIDVAYLLHADPASIRRSKCIILCYVEGRRHADIAAEVGYSKPSQVSRAISEGLSQLTEIANELNLS